MNDDGLGGEWVSSYHVLEKVPCTFFFAQKSSPSPFLVLFLSLLAPTYSCSDSSRQRRTLMTSNRSPSKMSCFTDVLPLWLMLFSLSRTSIHEISPAEFLITKSTGNA